MPGFFFLLLTYSLDFFFCCCSFSATPFANITQLHLVLLILCRSLICYANYA
jgi:hypothetical protein